MDVTMSRSAISLGTAIVSFLLRRGFGSSCTTLGVSLLLRFPLADVMGRVIQFTVMSKYAHDARMGRDIWD